MQHSGIDRARAVRCIDCGHGRTCLWHSRCGADHSQQRAGVSGCPGRSSSIPPLLHFAKRWHPLFPAGLNCTIYLFIAGSYTPFALGVLSGHGGTALLLVIWALAVAGNALQAFGKLAHPLLSTGFYLRVDRDSQIPEASDINDYLHPWITTGCGFCRTDGIG
jgi:hypothetical protein